MEIIRVFGKSGPREEGAGLIEVVFFEIKNLNY